MADKDLNINVGARDRTGLTFEKIAAAIQAIANRIASLDGKKAKVKVEMDGDRSVLERLKELDSKFVQFVNSTAMFARNFRQLAIPSLLASTSSSLASFALGLTEAAQAAALLPAAGIAAAGIVGTLAIGFSNLSDALGPTGTAAQIKKVQKAMEEMSPAGRALATTIRSFGDEWDAVKRSIQDQVLEGFAGQFRDLATDVLPRMQFTLGGLGDALNDMMIDWLEFVSTDSSLDRVQNALGLTEVAVRALGPSMTNVTSAFLDMADVGATFMPQLAAGINNATERFKNFIAEAKQTGELQIWIAEGIARLEQLGSIAMNVGGILGAVFSASKQSGSDFLTTVQTLTQEVETLLKSGQGQVALVAAFKAIREVIDALLPGVKAAFSGIAQAVASAAPALQGMAQSVSAVVTALAPALPILAEIAGTIMPMLSATVTAVAGALGPLPGIVLATAIAFKAFERIGAMFSAMAPAIATAALNTGVFTERVVKMGGDADKAAKSGMAVASVGEKVAGAFSKAASALPLLGVAIVGVVALYDELTVTAQESADSVIRGENSIKQAMQERADYLSVVGTRWYDLILARDQATVQAEAVAQAERDVRAALEESIGKMGPLEAATTRLRIAQMDYDQALRDNPPNSQAVLDAANRLAAAQNALEAEQRRSNAALQDNIDLMVEQSNQAKSAADAGINLQMAVIRVAEAEERAAEAARKHGAGSREAEKANLDLLRANLDAAEAARRKAEADGTAAGASNTAALGAQAYRDKLVELAGQATGPTKAALLGMIADLDRGAAASLTAEDRTRLFKDQLSVLAGQASGPTREAMLRARDAFNLAADGSLTAEQQAQRQAQALLALANMASGPLRTELQRMAAQVLGLPDGEFTVTGRGVVTLPSWTAPDGSKWTINPGGVTSSRVGGLATGGYVEDVLPGYTPGKDVHSFYSPTAGRLELSGGEAIMRPEFTAALGKGGVNALNKAAREGGTQKVMQTLWNTAPRPGEGIKGDAAAQYEFSRGGIMPTQKFAMGGVFRAGAWYGQGGALHGRDAQLQIDGMKPFIIAKIQEAERKMQEYVNTMGGGDALAWARTQVGKPYIWGGVGPAGYDCSGFMSAILNVLRKRPPHSRVGSTASFPWPGGAPGIGPGLSIGSSPNTGGGIGHMAGTIGGVNVESSGGVGVRVGGGARGAGDGMFSQRAHYVADRGGMMKHGWTTTNLSGLNERVLSPRQTNAFERLVGNIEGHGVFRGFQPNLNPAPAYDNNTYREIKNMRTELRSMVHEIMELTRSSRSIHVNSSGRNPQEIARSVALALRIR